MMLGGGNNYKKGVWIRNCATGFYEADQECMEYIYFVHGRKLAV
jgi:hypothetical protein